ncbi:hypothetical protein YN1_5350 [Nanoarchaeota archaeon]
MSLIFISALLLLLDIFILSVFDLRYLINFDRKLKIPKYKDLERNITLFILFPVKNEEQEVLIKKIEYLEKIENKYNKLKLYFAFIDDTDINKEELMIKYLRSKGAKEYIEDNFYIFDLDKIKYLFRLNGIKRKGAALDDTIDYLVKKYNIEYVSIYDFEWTINVDYLYKALCILESNKDLSFVYWNRRTVSVDYFHKIVGIYVDTFFEFYLPMKNLLDDISMAHGSCGILRIEDYNKVGKFTPHLTEDASLTLRLYLNGYRGLYIRDWVEYGQNLPPNFNMTLKTLRRWQSGTFDVIFSNFWKIIKNKKLNLKQKISFIHMFSSVFLPIVSFILISISLIIIIFNISSSLYPYISIFFYFSQIYIISIFISEYYLVEKRIYSKGYIKDAFLTLLLGWGISALTIIYYLRRIFLGLDNKWIVTKKLIRRYNYDLYSIIVFSIFLMINLYFVYYSWSSLIKYFKYIGIYQFLLSLILGNLSTYIWIISLIFIFYLQYRSYHMKERDLNNLLYLGISDGESYNKTKIIIKNDRVGRNKESLYET